MAAIDSEEMVEITAEDLKRAFSQVVGGITVQNSASANFDRRMVDLTEKCHCCGRQIHTEEELFYTIGKEPKRKDKIEKHHRQRILFFHENCFEEIAGELYL